jgi:hypothetical protein
VRVRIEGLVQTYRPDRTGWGVFDLHADGAACWREAASPQQIDRYLSRLPVLRVRLAYRLQSETWLSWPVSNGDYQARFGPPRPLTVQLAPGGDAFEVVQARYDGTAWWFEQIDRGADPRPADLLRQALAAGQGPDDLRFHDLTPEMRTVYGLAAEQHAGFEALRETRRLQVALALGNARLQSFQTRDDVFVVTWVTAGGETHVSAISPQDLTVISAGICLSDGDRTFDLQSLPGVVDDA